jgi:transaldolase
MTIPPGVIEKMEALSVKVDRKLIPEDAKGCDIKKIKITEKLFRWMQNEDEIGNEKLADGIRLFTKDTIKLEKIIKDKLH